MIILVTGGAGYVGSHVCKALAADGHVPITYDNLCRGHRAAVQWGPFEEGDITDRHRLTKVMRRHKPSAVMHLAGLAYVDESVANPLRYYTTNVAGTLSLLGAMEDEGVDRIVASSSCSIYASMATPLSENSPIAPASPYAASKAAMERAMADCAACGSLRWVALRFFNAAGADPDGHAGETTTAGVRVIPNLFDVALGRRKRFRIHGHDYDTADGTCVRDFTHVSDLAQAHVKALAYVDRGGSGAFNLGNGKGYSIRAVIDTVSEVTGMDIPVEVGPRRAGDTATLVANAERARTVLDWQPQWTKLSDIINHAWEWCGRRVDSASLASLRA